MRLKCVYRKATFLAILFLLFLSKCKAQTIEFSCPGGTSVLSQIENPVTSAIRQWLCIDYSSNVTMQGVQRATVPLLSNALVASISSNGTSFTITCSGPQSAGCGLTVGGPAINLGTALPVGCADATGNVTAISGNTATIANTGSCTFTGPPLANQLGQIGPAVVFQNAAGDSTHNAAMNQTADGHITLRIPASPATVSAQLDMQNGGPVSLGSNSFGNGFSVTGDLLACVGTPFASLGATTCQGAGFANTGLETKYGGLASSAGKGQPFIVYGAGPSSSPSLSGFLIWTAPGSGYGAGNLYEISFNSVETAAAAGATLTYTVNYTDQSGANSQTSGALPMATIGAKADFTARFPVVAGSNVTISTTLANAPVFQFYVVLKILQ